MKGLVTQVERDQSYATAMESRVNGLSTDFVNRDDPAQRAAIAIERDKATAELNRLRNAVIDGQKAIAALEDEARRANVPPGWLR
jgi:ATP-dependent exoDNAse (exonuclease V) alpha subunit